MTDEVRIFDPTGEQAPAMRERLAPPASLEGKTVALFDIGKTRSDEFLDSLEPELNSRGINTLRVAKPTNAKVATPEILWKIVDGADVVVEALAD